MYWPEPSETNHRGYDVEACDTKMLSRRSPQSNLHLKWLNNLEIMNPDDDSESIGNVSSDVMVYLCQPFLIPDNLLQYTQYTCYNGTTQISMCDLMNCSLG